MSEREFKKAFLYLVKERFADLEIVQTAGIRSFPDVLILGVNCWAALEFKRREKANRQPNQEFTIARLEKKGYARFVYPENAKEVLNDLERIFAP